MLLAQFSFVHLFLLSNIVSYSSSAVHSAVQVQEPPSKVSSTNDECASHSIEKTLFCRASRALRNVIHNLNKSEKPIVIVRGLEIVRSRDAWNVSATEERADGIDSNDVDVSVLARLSEFLRTHELNIKFSDLLAEESERFLARDLERNGVKSHYVANDGVDGSYVEEARKKDKGQGIIMAVALMFGKMMAVLGLGGIGALAMKALGIATAALMMAGILGLKSLSQNHNGHESSHSVQYLAPDLNHHKRRRRSLSLRRQLYADKTRAGRESGSILAELAYKGWK